MITNSTIHTYKIKRKMLFDPFGCLLRDVYLKCLVISVCYMFQMRSERCILKMFGYICVCISFKNMQDDLILLNFFGSLML